MNRADYDKIISFLDRQLTEQKSIAEYASKSIVELGTVNPPRYAFAYTQRGTELARCDGAIYTIELIMSFLTDMVDE